jgi:hypothetical protein
MSRSRAGHTIESWMIAVEQQLGLQELHVFSDQTAVPCNASDTNHCDVIFKLPRMPSPPGVPLAKLSSH